MAVAVCLLGLAAGCAAEADSPSADPVAADSGPAETAGGHEHSHAGWWCDEHGVPEAECGLCDSKLAAKLQRAGDWCQDHDRPDSQCFACHPELKAQFAARYVAKYGKEPPEVD